MAQQTYAAFCDRMIRRYEGGYGWDRADPGGPTKYGITCYDLAEHRGQTMDSMARWAPIVEAMTLEEAEEIYKTKYAARLRYDDLRAGVDAVMFDYGVNSGVARPIRVARALLSMPGPDVMSDVLVEKINGVDAKWFIDAMCAERLHFMHQIRGGSAWAQFGKGWGARVNDLEAYGEHLALGSEAPEPPDLSHEPTPKAHHHAPKHNPGVAGGAGAGAGGAAAAAGLPGWAVFVIAAVAVACAVLLVVYQQQKAKLANATVVLPPSIPPMPKVSNVG